MIIKLIAILFLGFLSTDFGEIKAEDICTYSSTMEYEKCIQENKHILAGNNCARISNLF